jgi:hypothetical protein
VVGAEMHVARTARGLEVLDHPQSPSAVAPAVR